MSRRILFASDIDNTLVYSYKKKEAGYICIEQNKGKNQGFMTNWTFKTFPELYDKVTFIPVTTRSIEQYLRINWPNNIIPEYALVTNGATLLHNNEVSEGWNIIKREEPLLSQLKLIFEKYRRDKRFINCKIIDNSYVFVYCSDQVSPEDLIRELQSDTEFRVEASGRKIYFFPQNLSKGIALKNFTLSTHFDLICAAGDSNMDISLLNQADIAIIPDQFECREYITSRIIQCSDQNFSEFVLKSIMDLL